MLYDVTQTKLDPDFSVDKDESLVIILGIFQFHLTCPKSVLLSDRLTANETY